MPSAPAIATYIFGLTALATGILLLLNPSLSPPQQQLPLECQVVCTPMSRANAAAAIAMGVYYPLLAYQENRAFFVATVPVRLLSSAVFTQAGPAWQGIAIWEAAGATATAASLLWEYIRSVKPQQNRKRH